MRRGHRRPGSKDPVAVYDAMREAADRVTALLATRVATGGSDDPTVRAMRRMADAIATVPTDDLRAQRVMTERLRHLNDRLAEDPRHEEAVTLRAWRKVTGEDLPVPSQHPPGEGSQ